MAAPSARGQHASTGALSIGQVLARLSPEFPKLTSSKLRFLELQGIVTPTRTASGYRKFSLADVDRLRVALELQRDHYLPLTVIREYLEDRDAGRESSQPLPSPPPSIHPQGRRYRRDELLQAAGAPAQLLNDAISIGLMTSGDSFDDHSLSLLRALAALERHGIEPRHLRALWQGAQRDVALIESALAPLIRRTDAASRAGASEVGQELAHRLDEVRAALVQQLLSRLLP